MFKESKWASLIRVCQKQNSRKGSLERGLCSSHNSRPTHFLHQINLHVFPLYSISAHVWDLEHDHDAFRSMAMLILYIQSESGTGRLLSQSRVLGGDDILSIYVRRGHSKPLNVCLHRHAFCQDWGHLAHRACNLPTFQPSPLSLSLQKHKKHQTKPRTSHPILEPTPKKKRSYNTALEESILLKALLKDPAATSPGGLGISPSENWWVFTLGSRRVDAKLPGILILNLL